MSNVNTASQSECERCFETYVVSSAGFIVGGAEARLKRGPLMTSSYSANRDNHF